MTDGASIGMGTRAFVGGAGPIGYGIAAYSTSVTIDNTINNRINPWLFSFPFFGGVP